jgi:hypothetical protein
MVKRVSTLVLGLLALPAGAQTLTATCDTLAQTVGRAPAGATVQLSGSCGPITLRNRLEPLTIDMRGATALGGMTRSGEIRGLTLTNVRNMTWLGGTIRAEGGHRPATSAKGYGVNMRDAHNIRFDGVRVTEAVRGIVIHYSRNIAILKATFDGLRSDGVNFVGSHGLRLEQSRFRDFRPLPSTCTYPDGSVGENLSKGTCEKAGGKWRDGDHADVFQTWADSSDILVANNDILTPLPGWSQGITTFGSKTVRAMRVLDNRVVTDHSNAIAVANCTDGCLVRGNYVSRATDRAPWAVGIRIEGGTTVACGNVVTEPRRPLGTEPC